ncbi:MAG: CAP domain-containing protein [Cyanobacteria bacterium P01_A01_bin.123]
MAQPSANEQYMLELVNRARSNPNAEAAQYGIGLNQGLPSGTISGSSKQPLAFNFDLIDSSRNHSQWMLNTDTFSHTGAGGSSAGDRMRSAGYDFTGSWTWGENISWRGTTGTPNVTAYVGTQHEGLFKSSGHRTNILNDNFKEIGIGIRTGEFQGYNAVMATQNFAKSGSSTFLTGVAFDDGVTDDDFYTVGEGLGGIQVKATRQSDNAVFSTNTYGSGGYQVALTPGKYDVTFSGGGLSQAVNKTVTINSKNVKLDLDTDDLPTGGGSGNPTPTADVIGEYGKLSLNHQWKTITLDDTYDNPVVIVSDPSLNGSDPAAIRLRNITDSTFQVRLQEPNYKDGKHTNESVSYLVMEAGDWELADGTRLSAGTRNSNRLTSKGFDSVNLTGFESAPTVLSQVQTFNGGDWVTTRTTGQTSNGFKVAMQEEEALNQGTHVQETIGWLAVDQGQGSDGDTLLQGGTTGRSHTHNRGKVNFAADFNAAPSLIAKLGSFYGSDTANLRLDAINSNSFGVGVHEEQSRDSELNHTTEAVSFLALEGQSGVLTGLGV